MLKQQLLAASRETFCRTDPDAQTLLLESSSKPQRQHLSKIPEGTRTPIHGRGGGADLARDPLLSVDHDCR